MNLGRGMQDLHRSENYSLFKLFHIFYENFFFLKDYFLLQKFFANIFSSALIPQTLIPFKNIKNYLQFHHQIFSFNSPYIGHPSFHISVSRSSGNEATPSLKSVFPNLDNKVYTDSPILAPDLPPAL